jgi:hypothetical protein
LVVVHRAHGYRFVIYTQDHAPAHIHLIGAGNAKIDLIGPDGSIELVYAIGIKRPELRRLLEEVAARRDDFLQDWERIHGEAD